MHLSPTAPRRTTANGAAATGTSPALAEPAAPKRPIRVMSYNIHHGRGIDDRLDLARVAGEIRHSGADVVGLQEVDRHWSARSDLADQAADLARELDMHLVYGANLDLDPPNPGQPRRQYGNALLSDAPIHQWRNILLPRTGNLEQRGLLEALVTVRGVPLRVFTTHLQHNSQQERIAQIAAIRKVIGTSQESVVLTGDLNARPDTPEIDALTEDLVDAWTQAGVGDGYTYPAENPTARLDYVLHSTDVMTCAAAVLNTDGSDHLPVTADLEVVESIVLEKLTTDVSDEVLAEVIRFYNGLFPKSPHTKSGKARRYHDAASSPINIVARVEGRIVALLESRDVVRRGTRMRQLDTIVVDPTLRGQGVARRLFDNFLTEADPEVEVVLHFRERNRPHLSKLYSRWGFASPHIVGKYRNGEQKWEMVLASRQT